MARFVSCYAQSCHERNELSRLSYRSLRDIGLTTHDVEEILRRVRPEGAEEFGSEAIRLVTTAREPDEMNSSARNGVRPQV